MALTEIPIELSSTPSIVDGGNATAITIDSSENVLVGTTSTAVSSSTGSVTGTVVNNSGLFEAAKTGTVMELNRLTADGKILNLRKDGTTVGSIGTSGSQIYIGTGASGLFFNSSTNQIYPLNTSTQANEDGTQDLGRTTARFKDLYLSGGAFLGGTGAANKLEDYEEGTWTPTDGSGASLTLGATNNRYTKVGRLVVASVRLTFPTTSSTALAQVALPFTVDSNAISSVSGGVCTEQNYDSDITLTAAINDNTRVIFRKRGASGLTNANLSGKILRFTVTYHAA